MNQPKVRIDWEYHQAAVSIYHSWLQEAMINQHETTGRTSGAGLIKSHWIGLVGKIFTGKLMDFMDLMGKSMVSGEDFPD